MVIPYDVLLLASGASPRTIVPGALTFRGAAEADRVEQIAREARCDVIFALDGMATDAAEDRELFDADSKISAFANSLVLVARAAANDSHASVRQIVMRTSCSPPSAVRPISVALWGCPRWMKSQASKGVASKKARIAVVSGPRNRGRNSIRPTPGCNISAVAHNIRRLCVCGSRRVA